MHHFSLPPPRVFFLLADNGYCVKHSDCKARVVLAASLYQAVQVVFFGPVLDRSTVLQYRSNGPSPKVHVEPFRLVYECV